MADVQVTSMMVIRKDNLYYQDQPSAYTATLVGTKGPVPGAISVPTTGVDVDLSQLTTPGLCRIANLDLTNYVEWGIHDGSVFHPVGEVLPGEFCNIRLSRN